MQTEKNVFYVYISSSVCLNAASIHFENIL